MRALCLCLPLTMLILGCGGSARPGSPVTPSAEAARVAGPADGPSATGILGGYSLTITGGESGLSTELTPLRGGALGQSFTVSGAGFFTGLCADCLTVTGVRREGAGLAVAFNVKHPFAAGDTGLPPSATNRLDLDVFDLSLVVAPLGAAEDAFVLMNAGMYAGLLTNADGYTTELGNVTGDPTGVPYVLVVDDSVGGVSTNNKFAMGTAADTEAHLVLDPGESVTLQLYLTMGYGASATRPTRLSPQYFLPEFNRKAAWKVDVTAPPAEFGQTWSPLDNVTPYPVEVAVYDWQVGATVDPNLDEPTDVANASEVAEVSVEIPGVTNALAVVTTPTSGTGTPGDPLIFDVPIANQNLVAEGTYLSLVKVTDTRTPGTLSAGGDPDTLVHTEDGATLAWYAIPEYATYQTFTAHVVGQILSGDLTVGAVQGSRTAVVGYPFTYSVQASTTVPSVSLTYNWDNGETTPGIYDDGTAVDDGEIDLTFTAPGTYTIDVQVGDTLNVETSSKPLTVTVFPDGTFVDGDNVSDPMENGSWIHPYDRIQEGVGAAGATGRVFVDAATTNYDTFSMPSNRSVIGIDRFKTGNRPTILVLGFGSIASSTTTNTIQNLVFDVSPGGSVRFSTCANVTIKDCKFTGQVNASFMRAVEFYTVTGGLIQGCEFTGLHNISVPTSGGIRLIRPLLLWSSTANVTIKQNEFHDIGFTVPTSSAFYNGDVMDIIMNFSPLNVTVSNNLFYDIFEPTQNYNGGYSYVSLCNAHTTSTPYTFSNNTADDIRLMDGGGTTAGLQEFIGFNIFTDPGSVPTAKNNVMRVLLPALTSKEYLRGFSGNCCQAGPFPATYTNIYFGAAASGCPAFCNWNAYGGSITKGTGSYDHLDLIDPNFDLTPGPNFYHPQNATVLNGGEGGSQMGCFGGPDGNWTPPSQL